MKKKRTYHETFMPNTEATSKGEIIAFVKKADYILVKDRSLYNDDTQSLTIQIHAKSKGINQ